jgi:anti-sigma regulatory factor (Ser/Thr protein kinase)
MNTPHETKSRTLVLQSVHGDVEKLHDFLRSVTVEFLGDDAHRDLIGSIILSVHEVFTNIVRHAYGTTDGEVLLHYTYTPKGIIIEIIDHGTEFNPLESMKYPDIKILDELETIDDLLELEESRLIGGHGIPIIQAATTSTEYRRCPAGDNHLYMYFEIP